jgi:HSP20 family protein
MFSDLERIRSEMDRLFESLTPTSFRVPVRTRNAFRPPTDVYETEDCVEVKVEVAGMQPEDFEIALAKDTLVISGVRHDSSPKRAYQQMEISWGEFRTEVLLPWPVDEDRIEAHYANGFLTVTLPRAKSHPRRIPIDVKH